MGYLLNVLSGFSFFKKRDDDDLVDRMHYFFTTNLLIVLSILVSWKQFGGKPIECMVPDTFPSGWEQYAENYCWAQDTYFLPFKDEVPKLVSEREDHSISYYQWVPFFLLIEAVFFCLPAALWHILNGASGIRMQSLIKHAKDNNNIQPEVRAQTLKLLTCHLENALRFQHRRMRRKIQPHKLLRCLNMPYKSSYLVNLYLLVKFCYLVNVVGQVLTTTRYMHVNSQWCQPTSTINETPWSMVSRLESITSLESDDMVAGSPTMCATKKSLPISVSYKGACAAISSRFWSIRQKSGRRFQCFRLLLVPEAEVPE